jgi:hypothetical protein
MPSSKKCPDCKLCLDYVYFMPRRFFHCFLCLKYYDIIDGKLTVIIPDDELKKHLDLIIKQEEKVNERFA